MIDLYFNWRGGAAFERLRSFHLHGVPGPGALHGGDIWLDRSGRWRHQLRMKNSFGDIFICTPAQSWTLNPSGQPEPDPMCSEDARRMALIEFGDALLGKGGAQVALLPHSFRMNPLGTGTDPERARDWALVEISFGDDDRYQLAIDPKTGELGAYYLYIHGRQSGYWFADWRTLGGVKMPFWITKDGAIDDKWATRIVSVDFDKPFPARLFKRPVLPVRASFTAKARSAEWIDFDPSGGSIRFPVTLNGHEITAILDNGATNSAIDESFAAANGLPAKGDRTLVGAGPQSALGHFISPVVIRAGGLTLSGLTVSSVDLSPVARASGHPIALLLGGEAFTELVVDIDFPHHRLAFRDPTGYTPPAGAVELPLERDGSWHLVPISLGGGKPVLVTLDLGNSDTLFLDTSNEWIAKQLEGRTTSQSLYATVGGVQSESILMLRGLRFGGVPLPDLPASFHPTGRKSTRNLGNLGLEILRRYRVILDYQRSRLFLVPDREAIARPFAKNRLGMSSLLEGDSLSVMLVAPNGSAAKAGLKVGDKISMIDGRPVANWSWEERNALASGPVGTRIEITLSDGSSRIVTLEDFY